MSGRKILLTMILGLLCAAGTGLTADDGMTWNSEPGKDAGGPIVFRVVMVQDDDGAPKQAGIRAARELVAAMGDVPLKAVLVSECFEDWEYKRPMLEGICSVVDPDRVYGGATYGSFTQLGCTDFDSVCLLGIGGSGIGVSAALVTDLGVSKLSLEDQETLIQQRLRAAGAKLAKKPPADPKNRLAVLVADAHSPKNQYLVEGVQQVLGEEFPITGGSANKNAGQTYIYFRGKPYQDSALALMLSGDFRVALSGRKAMDNDAVVSTARAAAESATRELAGDSFGVFAFNCAGRRGKLRDPEDELDAIQSALGKDVPLFGCYCAGEVGPLDVSERTGDALSGGSGWHVMFTVLGR